jgi:hypothetical protein
MIFQVGEFVIESDYPHILCRVEWSCPDLTAIRPIDGNPVEVVPTTDLESFSIPAAMV